MTHFDVRFPKKEILIDDISNLFWVKISKKGNFDGWHETPIWIGIVKKRNGDDYISNTFDVRFLKKYPDW